jgi:hypothetical protein
MLPALTAIMRVRVLQRRSLMRFGLTPPPLLQRLKPGSSAIGCVDGGESAFNEWLARSRWRLRVPISAVVALFYSLSNQVIVAPL